MQNTILLLVAVSLFVFISPPAYAENSYVYVYDLPSWADYASNVMYLSTEAWSEANPGLEFYQAESYSSADFSVKWVKEFGGEYIGYAHGSQFIEVGLGDNNCNGQWTPYSENYITHIMTHEIGHIRGHEHSDDPASIMYPIALNREYGFIEKEYRLSEGYGQFVPFCTIKDLTSYYFAISTTDETFGFDYYVVPSYDEFQKWVDGKPFQYYSNSECFGKGWLAISGTCKGVSAGSGIIIIMEDTLTTPLETLTVGQEEIPYIVRSRSPVGLESPVPEEAHTSPPPGIRSLDTLREDRVLRSTLYDLYMFTAGDEKIPIRYNAWDNSIVEVTAYPEYNSLAIKMDVVRDYEIVLKLPRNLIDAKNADGTDAAYFVLVDSVERYSFEETADDTLRTLRIPIVVGDRDIEIIGTKVIPEFGSITVLVLASAIASIVIVSSRTRLSIMSGH